MPGRGVRTAASVGFPSAEEVACGPASVLFWVSRPRGGGLAALKVFRLGGTPEEQARPRTWMPADWRMWSELTHRHVLRATDYGETNDALYVATQWVNGPSLRAVLDHRTLDAAQIRELAQQLASALDAAAAVRLIHQDLKPENVLFASGDGTAHAYVRDFGAGTLAAWRAGADRSRTFRGTLDYAAPEQIEGRAVDHRTVVYSLACLLYETLTGATPYAGRSRAALKRAHLEETPPIAGGPADVDRVFATALAKGRDERYATCTELAEALCAALTFAPARHPARGTRRRRVGVRRAAMATTAGIAAAGAVAAASWVTLGLADAPDAAPDTPLSSDEFLAGLPSTGPTVKGARHSLPAAANAKRVATRKARGRTPAPAPRAPVTRLERNPVAGTTLAPAESSAAQTPAGRTPATASPPVTPAPSPAVSRAGTGDRSQPPQTTTRAAPVTPPPPPPPPPPADSTPPPPPPPPP